MKIYQYALNYIHMFEINIPRFFSKKNMRPITPNLELEIKNFGPIKNGKITLKPLTIFIGPSNTGKSYAAILIHTVLDAISKLPLHLSMVTATHIERDQTISKQFVKSITNKTDTFNILPLHISKHMNPILNDVFNDVFNKIFIKNFTSDHAKLIRHQSNKSSLKISSKFFSADIKILKRGIKISTQSNSKVAIHVNFCGNKKKNYGKYNIHDDKIEISTHRPPLFNASAELHENIFFGLQKYFSNDIHSNSTYLPASRSGVMQSQKVLTVAIIEQMQYNDLKNFEMPQLPGILSDFLVGLLGAGEESLNVFPKIVDELEDKLLHGKIIQKKNKKRANMGEIQYQVCGNKYVPLPLVSSSISDLAPLIMYLKQVLVLGDILIIEEPEAHLHPGNQILLAKILVKLIRSDLNLIVITHSPFILETLSHAVQKPNVHVSNDDYLKADEISAYLFKPDSTMSSNIQELPISPTNGIPQEEFTSVLHIMYEEYAGIKDLEID